VGQYISDPFIGFRLKRLKKTINNNVILQTNTLGLRANEIKKNESFDSLFLGGSFVYAAYASSQKEIFTEIYSRNSKKKVLNAGIGGQTLKQHFSLYHNYLSNLHVEEIFLILGFNDASNCIAGRAYDMLMNDFFQKGLNFYIHSPIKAILKSILPKSFIFILKKIKNFFHFILRTNSNLKSKSINMNTYVNEIYQEVHNFNNFCNFKNIKLHIILQPTLLNSNKKLTKYELSIFSERVDKDKKDLFNKFYNLLDKKLSKFINYHNPKDIFTEENRTIFVDEAHMGDFGNEVFADYLIKIKN
jgi:hypothetical protein